VIRGRACSLDENWYWTLVEWGMAIGRWADRDVRETAFSPTAFPEPKQLALLEFKRREGLS